MPVTIITGAGSGIGRALAIDLARRGHSLVLVGRRAEPLSTAAASLACDVVCVPADIAHGDSAGRIVGAAVERFGTIDNLVNNAGFAPLAGLEATTPAMIDEAFAVNAIGPAKLIAACWPVMAAHRRGCIVNVSTLGTADPFVGFFAYASAKGSVNVMARSCAKEGRAVGIRAFAVAPGAVETSMLRSNFSESKVPSSACLSPEAVAQVIAACIEGEHDDRNGETLFVASGRGVW